VPLSSVSALRVVDLGTGMAAALVAKLLSDAGATVERLAPAGDGVFNAIYPAHRSWRAKAAAMDPDVLEQRLASADVCLVGGEDHPDVATRRDAAAIAERHPHLVVVDLCGYVTGFAPGEQAVDLLVQARSGLAFEHYTSQPLYFAVPFPTYGQVLLATLGLWAALLERLDSKRGQVVSASLQHGAALFIAPLWLAADKPDAEFRKMTPKDVRHLIFRCADGGFIQFVMGVPAAVQKLYKILGIQREADPADRGIPKAGAPASSYFGDMELIAAHVIRMDRDQILRAAAEIGVPAGPVLEPGEFWSDEQIAANGILSGDDGTISVGDPIGWLGSVPAGSAGKPSRAGAGVLSGLLVLDFGAFVAGPFSSRLLADLGATVIKVEGLAGDPNRGIQRHYLACHMGKQSLVVDVKSPAGGAVLARLLDRADIVTHNFRVGVAERLGLDPESVRRRNPAAITLHTMSFGPAGPRSQAPGFDMVIQAMVGLERRAGGPDAEPLWYRTPFLDYATGALGAVAVLMSLYELRTAQRAADAWVSLLNSGLFLMSDLVRTADGQWLGPDPLDAAQLGTHPAERFYQTADGWIGVSARTGEQAAAFWRAVLGSDPPEPREKWDEAAAARLGAACATWPAADLLRLLRTAGVWAAPCSADGLADLLGSAAARMAGWVQSRPDERFGAIHGPIGQPVGLPRGAAPAADLRGAPGRGAHTRQILASLGYSQAEIDELHAAGVVV
jgi:crotonobetainyl-CoA:carnitine CoA-transferase CaiB-like acyl-CoA transferase